MNTVGHPVPNVSWKVEELTSTLGTNNKKHAHQPTGLKTMEENFFGLRKVLGAVKGHKILLNVQNQLILVKNIKSIGLMVMFFVFSPEMKNSWSLKWEILIFTYSPLLRIFDLDFRSCFHSNPSGFAP